MIDAGIYNALSQPRKSAFDYAREFEDQAMQREQMGMARQQNALALRTGQQKADEYTRSIEEQNALRGYLGGAPDLSNEQGVAGLYKAAPTLASGVLKDHGERRKTQAEVDAKKATTTKTELETRTAKRTQAIADIAALNSPEEAAQSIRSHLEKGDIDEVKFQSLMSTLPKDPAQFPTWQRNMVRSIMDAAKREELDQRARNDLIGPDGKVNQPLLNAKRSVAQAGATSVSYGTPMAGVDAAGNLVYFQPAKGGGAPAIVPGVTPPPKEEKPLPAGVVKQLTEVRDNAATLARLQGSFKDEYAGKGVMSLGSDMQLNVSGVLGADADAVEWWKNYRKQAELVERHALFGAALTPSEQASWRSADVGPGLDAKIIKRNLATRATLARKVLEATEADAIDSGYSPKRVTPIARRGDGAIPPPPANPALDAALNQYLRGK